MVLEPFSNTGHILHVSPLIVTALNQSFKSTGLNGLVSDSALS